MTPIAPALAAALLGATLPVSSSASPPLAAGEEPTLDVFAALDADALEVGGRYEVIVELVLPEGLDTSQAGAPAPIVQLDVPSSVRLLGRTLETYRELAQNEFLAEPYERLMKENPLVIPIEIVSEPGPDERIGINVVGYARLGDQQRFLRRRLELPVRALAEGEPADPSNSRWGRDQALLQIGDRAPAFDLPRADGTRLDLARYLGKKNVVVTTYRAFW